MDCDKENRDKMSTSYDLYLESPDASPKTESRSQNLSLPFSYNKDQKDSSATPGECGMFNLGNTCFMNAGLHCLLNTSPLMGYFLELFSHIQDSPRLTAQFSMLACKYWSGQYSVIHPGEFKSCLGEIHSQFQDYRQHDCQEFLALLLDTLHEETNNSEHSCLLKDPITSRRAQNVDEDDDVTNDLSRSQLNNSHNSMTMMKTFSPKFPSQDDIVHSNDQITQVNEQLNNSLEQISTPMGVCESLARIHSQSEDQLNNSLGSSICIEGKTCTPVVDSDQDIPDIAGAFDTQMELSGSSEMSRESVEGEDNLMPHIPILLNNAVRLKQNIPVLNEFYAKESKTLNTNVLVGDDDGTQDLNIDSHKFAKIDNDSPSRLNELENYNEPLPVAVDKNEYLKGLKNVNVEMDKCAKVSLKELLAHKKQQLPWTCTGTKSSFDPELDVKRMKIETSEKNWQYQELSKLNLVTDVSCKSTVEVLERSVDVREAASVNSTVSISESVAKLGEAIETNSILGLSESVDAQQLEEDEDDEDEEEDEDEDMKEAAENAWSSYVKKHNSIVVLTFHGMFKSTIVCFECNNVSVTFEPFMYLSVPVPYSMDRQICIWFQPIVGRPIRFLVTLNKNLTVQNLREKLQEMTGVSELEIAEVLGSHISKQLEDYMPLSSVNDVARKVFAFNMLPRPSAETDSDPCNAVVVQSSIPSGSASISMATKDPMSSGPPAGIHSTSKSETVTQEEEHTDEGPLGMDTETGHVPESQTSGKCIQDTEWFPQSVDSNKEEEEASSSSLTVMASTEMEEGRFTENVIKNDVEFASPQVDISLNEEDPYLSETGVHSSATEEVGAGDCEGEANGANSSLLVWNNGFPMQAEETLSCSPDKAETTATSNSAALAQVFSAGQWKSCAICLEELMDAELMVHVNCGGTFCQTCLEMSVRHYGEDAFSCPVCSRPASLAQDFVSLNDVCDNQPVKLRVITVPVVFCHQPSNESRQLIGYPRLLYVPNIMAGAALYKLVDSILPMNKDYVILITDGQGLRCSRCSFAEKCQGCLVSKEEEVAFRPGDNLAVCYSQIMEEEVQELERYDSDESVDLLRPEKPLHLYDCVQKFTDSEVLDEHNPWYCPRCERNQCAKKTMNIWQCPDRLIIHLKRFMYHDLSSTKIDNSVVFPLHGLDLSEIVSGPDNKAFLYDLYAIVCHFGGVNAGHYTCYVRHPLNQRWFYYNDEIITAQEPTTVDYSNAYILLYQRQGTEMSFNIPEMKSPNKIEEFLRSNPDGMTGHLYGEDDAMVVDLTTVPSSLAQVQITNEEDKDKTEDQSGVALQEDDNHVVIEIAPAS